LHYFCLSNKRWFYKHHIDKKQGKQQIVIGLMTDDYGRPIAIEVFEGNTQDPKTVKSQIEKLAERFGVKDVTLVGDRQSVKRFQNLGRWGKLC
jgi:transposase